MSRWRPSGRPRARRAAASQAGDPGSRSKFLRGLSLGALVGAAIAGSAIWDRRRMGRGQRVAPVIRSATIAADGDSRAEA